MNKAARELREFISDAYARGTWFNNRRDARKLLSAALKEERERCAKIAEESHRDSTGDDIAAAIRRTR